MPSDIHSDSTGVDESLSEEINGLNVVDFPMNYSNMPSSAHRVLQPELSSSSSQGQTENRVRSNPEAETNAGNEQENEEERVFQELCMACRAGDHDTVDSLLAVPNVDINRVDEWDYSPLILASLCGHIKIVELLLSRGAVCDRDTFQGARCIYGALNDTIRDVLISFDISKKVDMSQPFASHISSLLSPLFQLSGSDIVFLFPHVQGTLARDLRVFRLNRFILAARSEYFYAKLKVGGTWSQKVVIEMPPSTSPEVFKAVIDYIYLRTDDLPIDQPKIQHQLIQFSKKLGLNDLKESVETAAKETDKREISKIKHNASFQFVENARKDMHKFCEQNIIENKISTNVGSDAFEEDIDLEDIDVGLYLQNESKEKIFHSNSFSDIILATVDAESDTIVYYPVQKSILARSEYFETMFKSDIFLSSQEEVPIFKDPEQTLNKVIINYPSLKPENIPVIQICTSTANFEVTEIILSFLYYDDISHIPLNLTIELLFAADELFLERLKTMCAVNITSKFAQLSFAEHQSLKDHVGYNAYDLIRVAWQTRCERLEQHITKLMAYNLSLIFHDPKEHGYLLSLIEESAERIKERQDTDTIELVDDIRYYISKKYTVNDEFEDFEPMSAHFRENDPNYVEPDDIRAYKNSLILYERDIEMIDSLLNELELDA